jgi:twitching motility protein PilT
MDILTACAATTLDDLLGRVVALGGSDLHLSVGRPPTARVLGELQPLAGHEVLTPETTAALVSIALGEEQWHRFVERNELDCSYSSAGLGRFRVAAFVQRGSVGAVLRVIPMVVPPLETLDLPPIVESLTRAPRGLILVTGPTGSGKSTTLAAILDRINTERSQHIVTVEDPIEFLHNHKRSVVNQREVGADTPSFASALRHVLRQDPDVILVGELRDLETIQMALTAAETGHLVLASLHTQDAPGAVDRIIDVFPAGQQAQIRVQLQATLRAVLAQQLLPRRDGLGRVAACEVLVATPAVRNLIREAKLHQIPSLMQAGAQAGMQTMDQALANLVRDGLVDAGLAADRSHDRDVLQMLAGPPPSPAPPVAYPTGPIAPAPAPAPALGGFERDW